MACCSRVLWNEKWNRTCIGWNRNTWPSKSLSHTTCMDHSRCLSTRIHLQPHLTRPHIIHYPRMQDHLHPLTLFTASSVVLSTAALQWHTYYIPNYYKLLYFVLITFHYLILIMKYYSPSRESIFCVRWHYICDSQLVGCHGTSVQHSILLYLFARR